MTTSTTQDTFSIGDLFVALKAKSEATSQFVADVSEFAHRFSKGMASAQRSVQKLNQYSVQINKAMSFLATEATYRERSPIKAKQHSINKVKSLSDVTTQTTDTFLATADERTLSSVQVQSTEIVLVLPQVEFATAMQTHFGQTYLAMTGYPPMEFSGQTAEVGQLIFEMSFKGGWITYNQMETLGLTPKQIKDAVRDINKRVYNHTGGKVTFVIVKRRAGASVNSPSEYRWIQ